MEEGRCCNASLMAWSTNLYVAMGEGGYRVNPCIAMGEGGTGLTLALPWVKGVQG